MTGLLGRIGYSAHPLHARALCNRHSLLLLPGWLFCGVRALYIVLATNGGLGTSGPKNMILISTVPMYGVLTYLAFGIFRAASL